MRKITLEVADSDMAALEAEARARHIGPAQLLVDKLRTEIGRSAIASEVTNGRLAERGRPVKLQSSEEIDGSQRQLSAASDEIQALLRMQRELRELGSSTLSNILGPALLDALSSINSLLSILAASTDSALDQDTRRLMRVAILESTRGCWAGDVGEPKDGVYYQNKLRAEWT